MPPNWEALKAYYPDGAPHRENLTFLEIQNRIIINFDALPVLTKSFLISKPFPRSSKRAAALTRIGRTPNQTNW